jgi:hypothetical protein
MVQENDDLGFGGEIAVEDTGNLIKSFLVYGIGKFSSIHLCAFDVTTLISCICSQHFYPDPWEDF